MTSLHVRIIIQYLIHCLWFIDFCITLRYSVSECIFKSIYEIANLNELDLENRLKCDALVGHNSFCGTYTLEQVTSIELRFSEANL